MEAFVVKILLSLLIIVLMTSGVVTEKLSLGENGTKDRSNDNMNNTKNECSQRGTGTRRNIVQYTFTADRQCYTDNFVGGEPPRGLRNGNNALRYICQPPKPNQVITYYATMFDERYGIAVFSAYILSLVTASFPGQDANPDFYPTPGIERQGNRIMYAKQPFPKYKNKARYHRGHLVPAMTYSSGVLERYLSTYVYTNTVPQHAAFNSGKWKTFEETIRKYASNRCIPAGGTLYLLTGTAFVHVGPGIQDVIHPQTMNRLGAGNTGIYIPNSLWTAGCCVPALNPNNAASFAVIGNNEKESNFMQITLTQLQNILLRDVGPNPGLDIGGPAVELFPNSACVNNNLPNPLPETPVGG